jgi:hypothetical protein
VAPYKNVEDRQSNRSDDNAILKICYAALVATKAHKCRFHLGQRLLPRSLAQESSAPFLGWIDTNRWGAQRCKCTATPALTAKDSLNFAYQGLRGMILATRACFPVSVPKSRCLWGSRSGQRRTHPGSLGIIVGASVALGGVRHGPAWKPTLAYTAGAESRATDAQSHLVW